MDGESLNESTSELSLGSRVKGLPKHHGFRGHAGTHGTGLNRSVFDSRGQVVARGSYAVEALPSRFDSEVIGF